MLVDIWAVRLDLAKVPNYVIHISDHRLVDIICDISLIFDQQKELTMKQ